MLLGDASESYSLVRYAICMWRSGQREEAHKVLNEAIRNSPSALTYAGRAYLLHLQLEEGSRLKCQPHFVLSDLSDQIVLTASHGLHCQPASLFCADVSIATKLDYLSIFGTASELNSAQQNISDECEMYSLMDANDWADPIYELSLGMSIPAQSLNQIFVKGYAYHRMEEVNSQKNFTGNIISDLAASMRNVKMTSGSHRDFFTEQNLREAVSERFNLDIGGNLMKIPLRLIEHDVLNNLVESRELAKFHFSHFRRFGKWHLYYNDSISVPIAAKQKIHQNYEDFLLASLPQSIYQENLENKNACFPVLHGVKMPSSILRGYLNFLISNLYLQGCLDHLHDLVTNYDISNGTSNPSKDTAFLYTADGPVKDVRMPQALLQHVENIGQKLVRICCIRALSVGDGDFHHEVSSSHLSHLYDEARLILAELKKISY